jgi:hypothetical protein
VSNPTRLRNQIAALAEIHGIITRRLDPFIVSARLTLSENDGFPKTASGADRGTGTTGTTNSSSVERAAVANLDAGRISPTRDLAEVADLLGSAAIAYRNILQVFDRYVIGLTDDEKRRLRCIGDDTPEGAVCDNYADPHRQGRCVACYHRARRATLHAPTA